MNIGDVLQKELVRVKAKGTSPEMRLREDAGLTSLALIQVLTRLCTHFSIDIYSLSDRDFATMTTVGDLEALVRARVSEPAAAADAGSA
ncbi:MAG TPA: acyl carrier protein [Longimicrobium sp.]|jgi:acyl carrier protein|uniref:acyl carrier protein n=1 Tax=Longimicrobium sp. TaxID=2029185 RepID=UPI002EDA1569